MEIFTSPLSHSYRFSPRTVVIGGGGESGNGALLSLPELAPLGPPTGMTRGGGAGARRLLGIDPSSSRSTPARAR